MPQSCSCGAIFAVVIIVVIVALWLALAEYRSHDRDDGGFIVGAMYATPLRYGGGIVGCMRLSTYRGKEAASTKEGTKHACWL